MKRLILYLTLWLVCCEVFSQDINKAEYFINTDPGAGNGINIPITPSALLTNVTFDVNVAPLTDGFHTIHIRVRDTNGKWSFTEFRTVYKSSALPPSAEVYEVVAAEYFIDTDPGAGAGTPIAVAAGNILESVTFDVPIDALSDGFHTIHIRVKDENGFWSNTERRTFMKEVLPEIAEVPNLSHLEYFIDTDPGFGNGVSLPFTEGTQANNIVFTIDMESLPEGSHKLYVRAQDANNNWSLVHVEDISFCNVAPPTLEVANAITTSGFTLSWNTVPAATSYRLDLSTDDFETFVAGYQNRTVTGTTQIVTGLAPGTAYKARVRTVAGCTSVNSNVIDASTTLSAPSLNFATNITESSFDITWYPSFGATGYEIDISTDNFATYEQNLVTTTSISVTGLDEETEYQVRVRAVKGTIKSAYSEIQKATTLKHEIGPDEKQDQVITFGEIPAKTLGTVAFALDATASSGLEVAYTYSPNLSIAGNMVTLLDAGTASITASQEGDDEFNPAESVTRIFCVNPRKPTITVAGDFTANPILTSSNQQGNQWYLNGNEVSDETAASLMITEQGSYTVNTTVDECSSEMSAPVVIKVTGTGELTGEAKIYPVPAAEQLFVAGLPADASLSVVDLLGREMRIENVHQGSVYWIDTRDLASGTYLLTARFNNEILRFKFLKQ